MVMLDAAWAIPGLKRWIADSSEAEVKPSIYDRVLEVWVPMTPRDTNIKQAQPIRPYLLIFICFFVSLIIKFCL